MYFLGDTDGWVENVSTVVGLKMKKVNQVKMGLSPFGRE